MKLSAVLLRERLEDIIVSYHFGEKSEELILSRPEFLPKKSPLKNGQLYIICSENLSVLRHVPMGCCLICTGDSPPEHLGQANTIINIREEFDVFDVFNILNTIFEQYDNWERQLLLCVSEKKPMQRFVDASMHIFENPMYIVDSTLRQLVKSRHNVFSNTPSDVITGDMEKLVLLYASTQSVTDRDEATIMWNDQLKLSVITKALRSHNRFAIAVTLIEANRPFRESDIVLLDYMSYYVLMAFDFGHISTSEEESPVSLATVLTQLLREEIVPVEKVNSAQRAYGWEPDHSYRLLFIKAFKPEHNFATRIYQCRQMERQFTSAIAIASLDENNVVIVNTSLSEKYSDSILLLSTVLKRFDFVSGTSCEFSELTKVTDYYTQAKFAFYYGNLICPGKSIYDFSDYSLQFMLSHCCGGQNPDHLAPAGLKELIENDQMYGTSYLKTLLAYCDSKFNATHAAERLHIHRTTFLDRLLRIQGFLRTDFDDPSDRLHLLMSLELTKLQNQ